jgi:surface antigen Omp85-like protein
VPLNLKVVQLLVRLVTQMAKPLLLFLYLLGGLGLFNLKPAAAQESPTSTSEAAPVAPCCDAQGQESTQEKEGKAEEEGKRPRRGSIILAPLPIVSPAIGSGIVPVAGYIFQLQQKDKLSQPSVVGAAGLITNNGSRGFALAGDLFMKENRYELKSAYFHGNINYDLYGIGFRDGNAGLKLPLSQTGQVFLIEFLRNIGWRIFMGPRFVTGNSMITLRPTDGEPPPIPPDTGLETNLRAIGLEVLRDSRPNRFYPTRGTLIDFTADFFSQGLGSKYSFQTYGFTFNKYWSFGEKQVLAYNGYFCGTGGEPPFYGNCVYGANNELRGYTAGRYLDRYMFATQAEYRRVLLWRFGLVAFGGVGAVAPGASRFRANQFLPAGGTGVRFLLSKKEHVNLRTDFAWGKDNFTWSMGVGEAF